MRSLCLLFCLTSPLLGQTIPLWPDQPPQFFENAPAEVKEERGTIRNVTVPAITLFLPPANQRTGMAIIVCAGGGYGALDWKTHVEYAAEAFNAKGVAIIGLKYRLRPPHKLDNVGI